MSSAASATAALRTSNGVPARPKVRTARKTIQHAIRNRIAASVKRQDRVSIAFAAPIGTSQSSTRPTASVASAIAGGSAITPGLSGSLRVNRLNVALRLLLLEFQVRRLDDLGEPLDVVVD